MIRRSVQAAYSISPCIFMRSLAADTMRVSFVSCQRAARVLHMQFRTLWQGQPGLCTLPQMSA